MFSSVSPIATSLEVIVNIAFSFALVESDRVDIHVGTSQRTNGQDNNIPRSADMESNVNVCKISFVIYCKGYNHTVRF